MNDTIKMFIDNEEVVSNKEFTIKEEMLSASSTILNNCYPASWENTKDYASNFYYPKDYSKYILGRGNFINGDTEYSILESAGTNPSYETNIEKMWSSFEVFGNTEQETAEEVWGKNLLLFDSYVYSGNGITITRKNNSGLLINGTTTNNISLTIPFAYGKTLDSNRYAFSITIEVAQGINKDLHIGLIGLTGLTNMSISSGTIRYTTTSNSLNGKKITQLGIEIPSGAVFNNATIDFQLEQANSATSFEPATYTPPMPSPNNPSELVSVGYENLLIPFTQATANALRSDMTNFKAGTYTIYFDTSLTPTWQLSAYKVVNGTRTTIAYKYNANELTFTVEEEITLQIEVYKTSILLSDVENAMLVKGTQKHTYIPFGKYGIEVINKGDNLFNYKWWQLRTTNGITATLENNHLVLNGTATANAYIDFLIPSNSFEDRNNYWYVKSDVVLSNLHINNTGSAGTGSINITPTTSFTKTIVNSHLSTSGFLLIANGTTLNNCKVYVDVRKENIDLSDYIFTPYQSNTQLYQLDEPLRAIDEYKDRLYIENGNLYVERKIGSVVLNGSEEYLQYSTTTKFFTILNNALFDNNINIFCDKYLGKVSGTGSSTYDNYTCWLQNISTYKRLYFRNDNCSNVNEFKTAIQAEQPEIYYPLAESYIEDLGQVDIPYSYEGINNTIFGTGINTEETIYYYWKNYDVLFAGIVKNSGDISLRPTDPKYCSLQILDYKTFLSESDTLDFVISNKTIAQAIQMVVDAISGYGFILGNINISQANDIIGAYSTLNKTAYDVLQYLANISGSRWRARFVDSDTMAIDFYDPELLPRANNIEYTQQYWEDNKIVDLTFNYGTRDYRNKQIILSDEVYGGIDYTEVLLSNGYDTSFITQNNVAVVKQILVNGVAAEFITQSEKEMGVDADFYYTPGKNIIESTNTYTAGTQITVIYTPLVKGRQIVYNDEEVARIATQTNTTGIISRYESRNDILSSDELENIAETYIKYKGKPEIILNLSTLNNDILNVGEITRFDSPIAELAQDYMVKSKSITYITVGGETNIFYNYELTSSFNSEKAINYFDNQRNKAQGNIAEGESITRNIDINNSAMIIWENPTITEVSISVDGDNVLNSVLNSPFID